MHRTVALVLLVGALLVAGCVPTPFPAPAKPAASTTPPATQIVSNNPESTKAVTATAVRPTSAPASQTLPTTTLPSAQPAVPTQAKIGVTPSPEPTPEQGKAYDLYMDDRSTPQALLSSYFDAINKVSYAQAYSYWNVSAGLQNGLQPFDQFRQGYADTQSVEWSIGVVKSDVGAGQLYYYAPVTLEAHTKDGTTQTFVGCYRMHLARPEIQAVPPFKPLAIESASVKQVANDADTRSLMTGACGADGQTMAPAATPKPTDISAAQYIDNRSNGAEVIRSLFNAINRKEYARAYAYWETDSEQRPPFDQFEKGYANTASVDLSVVTTMPNGAAGSIYYDVPVVLISKNTDGSRQTFAGCYTLHMANPAMQENPPFQPLGIRSAKVRQVPNNSDTQTLLRDACSQP